MDGIAQLCKLCCRYGVAPTSYKLKGVVRDGDHSQRMSQVVEIWKGRYKNKVATLKVLVGARYDAHVRETESVSMSSDPQCGG